VLTPVYAARFKKDFKICQKRGYHMQYLISVMTDLENEIQLSPRMKVHPLRGNYIGYLECHIESDWLLIYLPDEESGEIYFVRTGTHADLFN
jgi:mRNA interferase YafQ